MIFAMIKFASAIIATTMVITPATARSAHHGRSPHDFIYHHRHVVECSGRIGGGDRCAWPMRRKLGIIDTAYNAAGNSARSGVPAGGPQQNASAVWPPQVGRLREACANGERMLHFRDARRTARARRCLVREAMTGFGSTGCATAESGRHVCTSCG
jgi:hypothetical protein